nr:MAG TPA: hypothetical protein [Caudoviricetes sp.]
MDKKFISTKEEFLKSMAVVLDTLGMPSDRVNALSTSYYQTQGLGELYDIVSYSSYIASREMFPITAQFKDSLFKWNKVADVSFQMAKASMRRFSFTMYIEDVLKNAEMINPNLYRYTIPHTLEVKINNFVYSLDYDIHIQIYDPEGRMAITARYDTDSLYNPISPIKNPNIKVIKQNKRMVLTLELYQYQRKLETYRYVDSSTDVYSISYEDQLIDFTPYYRVTEYTSTVVRLQKSMYYDKSIPDKPTIYYDLNQNKITLTNRGYRGNFVPVRDSIIELSMYLTKGKEANFEYIGDKIVLEDSTGEELPFYITVATEQEYAVTGYNEDDLETLRKKIIESLHTRNSLITDYDLSLHFSQRNKAYKVIKTRDDWKMRVYSIFAPLYKDNKFLIPTNTLDVQVKLSELIKKDTHYKIPETTHLRTGLKSSTVYPRASALGTDKFDYMLSLVHVINRPKRVVETYEMYIARDNTCEFEYNYDKVKYNFMVNKLYINREPNKNIKLSFNLLTNLASEEKRDLITFHNKKPNGEIEDTGQIKVNITFQSQDGNYIGYIPAKMMTYNEENDMYRFEAELETDYFIKDGRLDLSLFNAGVKGSVQSDIKFKAIKILVQDSGTNTENSASRYGVPDITDKALINVFSVNDIDLVKEYTDISGIQIEDIDADTIKLLSIPLFGYKYIEDNGYYIFNEVYAEMDYINTLWLQTQTNFTATLKFVNTYGSSKNHAIGNDNEKLDKVNISFVFKVGLKYNATNDLDYVRDYIRDYFAKIDFLNDDTFHVSDLIRKVRDDIPDVTKIEFVSINSYNQDYQYLYSDYDPNDSTIIPEIVNIEYNKDKEYNIVLNKI